jgi:hypothetical protein
MNTKKLLIIICILANQFINSAKAQAPQSFNYQAVARDAAGAVISNQAVSFRISLLQGSATGTNVYSETHAVNTNLFGLVNFAIGNGTILSGNFSTINWAGGTYFVKVELDATGGSTYVLMSTTQLISVPYALASNSLTLQSPNGTFWNVNVSNTGALSTTSINCVPVSGLSATVPNSFNAGSSYNIPAIAVSGTIPYVYNWSIVPNDPNITIQNGNTSSPTLLFNQNISPGTTRTLQAVVSNCNNNNSVSQSYPFTVTAPLCPNALEDTCTVSSNCNIIGGSINFLSGNQIGIVCWLSSNNCYVYLSANVNCANNTITIPSQTLQANCLASGTVSGSGTFNSSLTQITITYTTIINSVSNTCNATFTHL